MDNKRQASLSGIQRRIASRKSSWELALTRRYANSTIADAQYSNKDLALTHAVMKSRKELNTLVKQAGGNSKALNGELAKNTCISLAKKQEAALFGKRSQYNESCISQLDCPI